MRTNPPRALCGRRTAGYALRARQCGYGVLIALVILVLGSLYGLTRGLSQATAQTKHDDHDQAVLRQARDALVAYAALRPTRPGALPCPDLDDNGIAGGNHPVHGNNSEAFPGGLHGGTNCSTVGRRSGRLPWRTLGLPDLRDSNGERLWYALSDNFRNIAANPINSDTRGQFTITGLAAQNEVIAIVFAPGAALGGQIRDPAGTNIAANYLEGENGDSANDTFVTRSTCLSADCGGAFNDKMLAIGARDLFPVVENMVARRLQTDARDAMFKEGASFADKGHFQRWRDHAGVGGQGYFPYAAPFVQPDTSDFKGVWNTANGLMPVAQDVTTPAFVPFVQWELTNGNPAFNPNLLELTAGPNVLNAATACSGSTSSQVVCSVTYSNTTTPQIRITGHALNVANSFVSPVQDSEVTISTTATKGGFPCAPPSGPNAISNTHVTSGSVQGSARVEIVVALPDCDNSSTNPVTVVVARPPYNTGIVGPNWFVDNNWHRVTLYSVAPAATTVQPKDIGTGNPDCLLAGADCRDALSSVNGGTGRQLVLLLSGLPVDNNTPRPSAALDRYLEGRNVWTSGAHVPVNQFETFLRATGRNDKLAVVAP
jgi:hypothetical protein